MKSALLAVAAGLASAAWGSGLSDWTNHTASVSSCELSPDGLVARMNHWKNACIEARFPGGMESGPDYEIVFEAKAECPDCERLLPVGNVNPKFAGMPDYASQMTTRFRWIVDGAWHTYSFRAFNEANGRKLDSVQIHLPNEGRSSGVITFRKIEIAAHPVPPTLKVMAAEADGFARVGKPVEVRIRLWNRGTKAAEDVRVEQDGRLPGGVHWLKFPNAERRIEPDCMTTLRGELSAENAGRYGIALKIGKLKLKVPVEVANAPVAARCDYVPEPQPVKTQYEIAACYYPGWHEAERWSKIRRVCPEREPLLGWYDETKIEVVDWQLKWLAEHGISVLMLDWYWQQGDIRLNHYIEAFRRARYRKYVKWMVLWCNESQKKGGHSVADHKRVTQYWIDSYFTMPEYYRIDGKPVVGIFVPEHYVRDLGEETTKQMLALSREMAHKAGYPGIHFIGYMRPGDLTDPKFSQNLMALGFDETAYYNCMTGGGTHEREDCHSWRDTLDFNRRSWELRKGFGVPFWPIASSGWDDRPWNHTREVYGRNVKDFRALLKDMKAFADANNRRRLMIGPLNEWGEGSFFEPNRQFGFGMFDAIRDTFCEKPKDGWPQNLVPSDVGLGPYVISGFVPDLVAGDDGKLVGDVAKAWQPLGAHVKGLKAQSDGVRIVPGTQTPAIVASYEPFAAEDFACVRVKCRTLKPVKDGLLKIYWKAEGRQWCEQCASRVADFKVDGVPREYVLPLAGHPGWKGRIFGIRLQFSFSEAPEILVESVKFEKKAGE